MGGSLEQQSIVGLSGPRAQSVDAVPLSIWFQVSSVSSLFGTTRRKATTCYHLRSSAKIGTLYGETTARPMRKKSYDEFAFRCI